MSELGAPACFKQEIETHRAAPDAGSLKLYGRTVLTDPDTGVQLIQCPTEDCNAVISLGPANEELAELEGIEKIYQSVSGECVYE